MRPAGCLAMMLASPILPRIQFLSSAIWWVYREASSTIMSTSGDLECYQVALGLVLIRIKRADTITDLYDVSSKPEDVRGDQARTY